MKGKCKLAECPAPEAACHLGKDTFTECEHFVAETTVTEPAKKRIDSSGSNVGWDGQSLTPDNLRIISARTSPIIIGVVGRADAGKTSFLGMLYTLLLSGRTLKHYGFAGTKTILGWDQLYHRLKLKRGNVPFPQPTPVNSNRLYHLALRTREHYLKDLLFADASGEVFTLWSINREDENAHNARWIYDNSSAFMLFIDCEALLTERNAAKREIMFIAQQLTHDLRNRPVVAIWSKADKKHEVIPTIKDSLKAELEALFPNYHELEISNFLEPGPDELVHKNNLAAVDWLLEKLDSPPQFDLLVKRNPSSDVFLNYRGTNL